MPSLKLKIDPTGMVTGGRKSERELDRIKIKARETEGAVSSLGMRGGAAISGLARNFGTLAAAATSALTLGFFRSTLKEQEIYQRNLLKTQALLKATGGAAGHTAKQLEEQAHRLALISLQSVEGVMNAQQVMLTFRNVTGDTFDKAIHAALNMAEILGTDVKSSVIQLGKALNDPAVGMSMLTRSGITFTDAQKKMVKQLIASNDLLGAQKIILAEVNSEFGGAAKAAAEGYSGAVDTLTQRWQEFKLAFADSVGLADKVGAALGKVSDTLVFLSDHVKTFETGMTALGVVIAALASVPIGIIAGAVIAVAGAVSLVSSALNDLGIDFRTIKEVSIEVMGRIGLAFHVVELTVWSVGKSIKAKWFKMLAALQSGWTAFLSGVADAANLIAKIPGVGDFKGINEAAQHAADGVTELSSAVEQYNYQARALGHQAETLGASITAPLKSLADSRDRLLNRQAVDLLNQEDAIYKSMGGSIVKTDKAVTTVTKSLGRMKRAVNVSQSAFGSLADTISNDIGQGLMDMASGTKTVADSFRSMAADIVKELYKVLVVQRMVASVKSLIGGIGIGGGVSFANPLSFSSFAGGGFTGNAPRSGGLDGHGGFLAVMHPRETVVDHMQPGAGAGPSITINQTFTGGVTRADLGNAVPRIVEASKAAVLDAMKRHQGGFA